MFGREGIKSVERQERAENGFDKKARGGCSVFGKRSGRAEKMIEVAENASVNK